MATTGAKTVLLTPPTAGAIAVLVVAGCDARRIVGELASALADLPAGRTRLASLRDRDGVIDQALIVCLDAEHGDRFELHLHGGPAVIARTQAALRELGATILDPGGEEAAALAAPPGASLIQREVLAALPRARTRSVVELLAHQASTGLTGWVSTWLTELTMSHDLAGPNLWLLHSAAQWILDRSRSLEHLLTAPRVALIGSPNVGKSTLANALLGRTASITSDIPGTTRDWVDAESIFVAKTGNSAPEVALTLVDTAGIRTDPEGGAGGIEAKSIARSRAQAAVADVVIVVLDVTAAPPASSLLDPILSLAQDRPVVVALNKCDLLAPSDPSAPPAGSRGATTSLCNTLKHPAPSAAVHISALTHRGLDVLQQTVLMQLHLAEVAPAEPFAFTHRQRALLSNLAMTPDVAIARRLLRDVLGTSRPVS